MKKVPFGGVEAPPEKREAELHELLGLGCGCGGDSHGLSEGERQKLKLSE